MSNTPPKQSSKSRGRLIPLTKWGDFHDWPPVGGLRHLVYHCKTNGFKRVIKRAGNRVLIDEDRFFEWLDAQNIDEGASNE